MFQLEIFGFYMNATLNQTKPKESVINDKLAYMNFWPQGHTLISQLLSKYPKKRYIAGSMLSLLNATNRFLRQQDGQMQEQQQDCSSLKINFVCVGGIMVLGRKAHKNNDVKSEI